MYITFTMLHEMIIEYKLVQSMTKQSAILKEMLTRLFRVHQVEASNPRRVICCHMNLPSYIFINRSDKYTLPITEQGNAISRQRLLVYIQLIYSVMHQASSYKNANALE